MIKTYKEKASTVDAVEFTDMLRQSGEVANLIGATSMTVDASLKEATFTITDDISSKPYTVQEGQIIGLVGGQVVVMAADEFYAKYEAI